MYYIKEDVEKNRPLAQDSENRKKMKVSEEFPKDAFTLPKKLYKLDNDDTKKNNGKKLSSQFSQLICILIMK
ncbi:hypothetical protein BK711_22855 [Bacillus thuringiensis serovar fukuokaensis]|nr:hypothetical protein BK711_22855 [Bacillus thuringiensis serovar fukuokaensis]